ncbi:extracellular solute-binding protein [Paenibacillus sp. HJGM_3]|uniref:extracellular solute-binding protein n=1 Tax=Paenibacillus sp. HJGM_3 TaxID=3379816 RepID=UPI00385DEA9E
MRGIQKVGTAVLTLLLAGSAVLAGCSDSSGKPSGSGDSSGNPVPITWLRAGDMASKVGDADDRIIQEINKRLNIKLTIKMVPQNDFEKVTVAMASGDYPDVVTMAYPNAAVNQWIKDGILLPLNDYLKDMPTVKASLDKEVPWSAVNGNYYGNLFMTSQVYSNLALSYRKDWLKKLGMKEPTSLDEFYEVLKAMRTKDPDGNGKEDTYGLSAFVTDASAPMNNLDFIFYAYGMPYADWALDDKGNVIPRFEHPSFKKGMEYLIKLYTEKLLDPEFMVNNTIQLGETKFFQSKIGVLPNYLFRNFSRIQSSLQKAVPTGELGYMSAPKGPDGKKGIKGADKSGYITGVTKAAKDPKKAAQFIEFLRSKEGFDLLTLGMKDVHYKQQGDKIEYIEAERTKDGFAANGWAHWLTWGALTWPLDSKYVPATEPSREDALKSVEVATGDMVPNLVSLKPDAEVKNTKILNGIYNEYFAKLVSSPGNTDQLLKELSQKWRSQGGDEVLKAVTEIYNSQKQAKK